MRWSLRRRKSSSRAKSAPTFSNPKRRSAKPAVISGPRKMEKLFEIAAISTRENPVCQAIISEFPPSESTVIRKAAFDAIYLNHLKNACNIPSVTKVACYEMASCNMLFVIQLDRPAPGQPWQALRAAAAFDPSLGKIFIAVDSDVDPDSMDAVLWALSYSMQPHRDVEIIRGKVPRLDPSMYSVDGRAREYLSRRARRIRDADQCLPRASLSSGVAAAARFHGERARAMEGAVAAGSWI